MRARRAARAALLAAGLALTAGRARAEAWQLPKWLRSVEVERLDALFVEGRCDEIVSSLSSDGLQRLRFSIDRNKAYLYLGICHERARQYDQALGVLQLGARLFPKDTDILLQLGSLLHTLDLGEQARPVLQRALRLHPHSSPALRKLAEINRSLGLLDDSAQYYEKALDILPMDAELWHAYAEVLLESRQFETAEFAVRRAIRMAPSPESDLVLAYARRGQGDVDDALEILASLGPADSPEEASRRALLKAAWQLEAGLVCGALETAETVLRRSPDQPQARFIRARIRLASGRRDLALQDLRVPAAGKDFTARAAKALISELERGR